MKLKMLKGKIRNQKNSGQANRKRHGGLINSSEVGNGRRVTFWVDRWCRKEPLHVSSPILFALAMNKEAWVANVWEEHGEGGH